MIRYAHATSDTTNKQHMHAARPLKRARHHSLAILHPQLGGLSLLRWIIARARGTRAQYLPQRDLPLWMA